MCGVSMQPQHSSILPHKTAIILLRTLSLRNSTLRGLLNRECQATSGKRQNCKLVSAAANGKEKLGKK